MDLIQVQTDALDPAATISQLTGADASMGALASFVGMMRDFNDGSAVQSMFLEHYPGMTEKALQAIVSDSRQRWELGDVVLVHRVGQIKPAEPIVLVAVTSAHRHAAFDACQFIMDTLKTRAPFWKKEQTEQGERWVESRQSDEDAADRW